MRAIARNTQKLENEPNSERHSLAMVSAKSCSPRLAPYFLLDRAREQRIGVCSV